LAELFFADLVRVASQSTGAGPLALGAPIAGHRSFDIVPPGASFHYAVAGITHPGEWETGVGQIGAGGLLLRSPLASSASPPTGPGQAVAVDFLPGLKTVALTVAAVWFAEREQTPSLEGLEEALAAKADLAGANFTGPVSAPELSLADPLAMVSGGTGAATAVDARASLGLVIGSDVAAHDPTLAALAALGAGAGLVEQIGLAAFAKRALGTGSDASVLTRADGDGRYAPAAHGHSIGEVTGLQAALDSRQSGDPTLTALASLDSTAGAIEQTGVDSFSKRAFGTGSAGSILTRGDGDGRYAAAAHNHVVADVAGLQAALDGKQPLDAELSSIAGLASATDRLPYFTGSGTAALATFTGFGRSLVDDPDSAAGRATLGLGTAALKNVGQFGNNIPVCDSAVTLSAAASPLTLNSTGSNANKLILQDAGVTRGGFGCNSTYGLLIMDSALAAIRFSVVNGATPEIHLNSTRVVTTRRTGWGAPTGSATRSAFDTATATAAQLAERLKALIDDLTAHGLIGS
jgi:hypothetical protein